MTTEIWRDFDPNLDIPLGLKNARVQVKPEINDFEGGDVDSGFGPEDDDGDDEGVLAVPDGFSIAEQSVRTGPDGTQVVDVIIEVDDIDGAVNYEVRLTKV